MKWHITYVCNIIRFSVSYQCNLLRAIEILLELITIKGDERLMPHIFRWGTSGPHSGSCFFFYLYSYDTWT